MYTTRSTRPRYPRRRQSEDQAYAMRAFACDSCEKRFDRRHDLKRHAKLHQGIMDYRCEHCGRQFAQRNGLDVHVLTHLGIRILKCPEPDCAVKPFRDESSYRRHWMKFHSSTPPEYFCNRCNHKTSRKSLLAGHMNTQHNGAPLPMQYRARKERGSSPAVPPALKVKVHDSDISEEKDIRASVCSASADTHGRPLSGFMDFTPSSSASSDSILSSSSGTKSTASLLEEDLAGVFAYTVPSVDSTCMQPNFPLVPSYQDYTELQYSHGPVHMNAHHGPAYAADVHGCQYYPSFHHPSFMDALRPAFAPWPLSAPGSAQLTPSFMGIDFMNGTTGEVFGVERDSMAARDAWEDFINIDPALRNTV